VKVNQLSEYRGSKLFLPEDMEITPECKICESKEDVLYGLKKKEEGYYGFYICQKCFYMLVGLYQNMDYTGTDAAGQRVHRQ
jgi:hypothetical protein